MTKFKNLLLQNHWVNFNQTTKHPLVKGVYVWSRMPMSMCSKQIEYTYMYDKY